MVRSLSPALLLPLAVLGAVCAAAYHIADMPGPGRTLAFALVIGTTLGFLLQRTRFCFLCHARDFIERRDPRGLFAILLALAIGTIGYHVLFGAWVSVPAAPRLPPDAHIGPVSWVLVVAGLAFGLGMAISGSCVSAHLYRLGEGSPVAPFALAGTAGGFVLGFLSWNTLYLAGIATAPVVWLPHHLGYGGSLAVQLGGLGLLTALLWRWRMAPQPGSTQPGSGQLEGRPAPNDFAGAVRSLFEGRWPYWTGGVAVGLIGILVVLRISPLGVTSAIGGGARGAATDLGLIPTRLEGLDGFAGCATQPAATWMTPNALLVIGLILGGFAAALASGQFKPRRPTGNDAVRGLAGGLLLGWGAMTGLGCTIGTLLSGTMAAALSGWVYGVAVFAGVWLGLAAMRRRGTA